MTQQFQQDRELGWDDTIVQDSEGGIVLAPGDYIFEVVKFERARYTPKSGDSKLPACNMAKLELKIDSPQGTATVFNNLYLHTSTEGLLSAFFASIGQKKKGEPLQMNWNLVTGAKGAVKIKIELIKTTPTMMSIVFIRVMQVTTRPKKCLQSFSSYNSHNQIIKVNQQRTTINNQHKTILNHP